MGGKKSRNNLTQIVPQGFLESYILLLLRDESLHGYKIMKKIKEKTKFWKPSPGTIYPALHSLTKRGFTKEVDDGRKKRYVLTKRGLKISKEIKGFEERMKDKMSKILGEILGIDKLELEKIFEDTKKKHRESPLAVHMHNMFNLLLKISDKPEKCLEAAKILKETNRKLRKIVKMEM
ncbi:MAG: PadR family transcriptional regulator [Candidatus Aenigmarchaeota archaeon]|nr:PadR family transcriptional regulator [Candidatus Aenigmarchaeota archaeon]